MTLKDLDKVLYFEKFIITEPGLTDLKVGQLISEDEFIDYQDKHGEDSFQASIGAEAIDQMLTSLDLKTERIKLKEILL